MTLRQNVPPLLEYIRKISPEFDPPHHLTDYCALLERAAREPVRALITYPIRHYKTETTLHGVLRMLEIEPTLRIIILCHSHARAQWMGKRLRELAGRTDVGPKKGWNTIDHWQNKQGGGVVVMSADQSKEGYDCHVLVCDDPIDEHGAQSMEKRVEVDRAITYYTARCVRKGRPGPVLIVMSRFHPDDPVGRRMKRTAQEWEPHHHPAIMDLGKETERAFAPEVWPLDALKKLRAELAEVDPAERVFWARLQGEPKPDSLSAFRKPARYVSLPEWPGFRDAMGIDMSFSRAKRADYAAIVITRWWKRDCYVRWVRRVRADLGSLTQEIYQARSDFNLGSCPIFSYVSGPERGAITHLAMMGIAVTPIQASAPKFVRAQRAIDSHNAGRIVWPSEAWVDQVMGRLENWRGNEDDPDDEADALVSVHDGMMGGGNASGIRTLGSWRY